MPAKAVELPDGRTTWPTALAAGLLTAAIPAISLLAPTEQTMGHAQRIMYVHVSAAWVSLLSFVLMAATGLVYLVRRELDWDHWSRAASELGWLFCTLTLLSGSFWARGAWGTWWTWEPRLTATLVLWAIYSGYVILRGSLDDPHRGARLGAVLALVGAVDLPLVVLATRWFRGIHPASPAMAPSMRVVLVINVVVFSLLFVVLLVRRRAQLRLEVQLASLQRRAGL